MAREDGSKQGAQGSASAQGKALSEGDAEVAHTQAECQTTDAPQHAVEEGHARSRRVAAEELAEAMPFGNSHLSPKQRKDKPGKDALHYPVTLPTPTLDLIDGDITARLAESPYRDDK